MDELYDLKDILMQELADYASKEMNSASLDVVDKLAHTVKNLCKILDDDSTDSYRRGRRRYSRMER